MCSGRPLLSLLNQEVDVRTSLSTNLDEKSLIVFTFGSEGLYITAFFENVNWKIVEHRFTESQARRIASRFSNAA